MIQRGDIEREPILKFFTYGHLPRHLGEISKPFCDLAESMYRSLQAGPERTTCLRKLLEAKDCAVRGKNAEG